MAKKMKISRRFFSLGNRIKSFVQFFVTKVKISSKFLQRHLLIRAVFKARLRPKRVFVCVLSKPQNAVQIAILAEKCICLNVFDASTYKSILNISSSKLLFFAAVAGNFSFFSRLVPLKHKA